MSQSRSPIILTHEQQQSMMRFERTLSQMRSPHSGGAIAYAGTSGSYAEEAALRFFGTDSLCIAHKTFEDVFKSITGGGCDYGVLPIENTSTGSITAVYDLLAKYRAAIVGEISIAIRHCLLGNQGASLADIQSVYSHEQGFAQSQAFLSPNIRNGCTWPITTQPSRPKWFTRPVIGIRPLSPAAAPLKSTASKFSRPISILPI